MSKKDRTISRYAEELPAVNEIEHGTRWVDMATQGTRTHVQWTYDWNKVGFYFISFKCLHFL